MAVQLTKKPKINLVKGQTICLTKEGTPDSEKLNKVFFGASWSGKRNRSIDLDASLILYDKNFNEIETIYYGHKVANNSSIKHSGDDLIGGSTDDADNETITISLNDVRNDAKYIVAVLNSYSGESFNNLSYIRARIYTGTICTPEEILCSYQLNNNATFKGKTSIVLGFFIKEESGWKFKADGRTGNDTRVFQMVKGIAFKTIAGDEIGIVNGNNNIVIQNSNNCGITNQHNCSCNSSSNWFGKLVDFILDLF